MAADCYFSKALWLIVARVAALIYSKPFVSVIYEFSMPLSLVCLLFVSTAFATMLGTWIFMYTQLCTYMYTHNYMYIYVHTHGYTNVCTSICAYTLYMCTCSYIHVSVHTQLCTYMYMYIHSCIHVHTCMCTHIPL